MEKNKKKVAEIRHFFVVHTWKNVLPLMTTKAQYFLPDHEVYGITKTGKIGSDLSVRYFHIYYDNIRAGQEKNEYLKQLEIKEEHVIKRIKD